MKKITIKDKTFETYLSEAQLAQRIQELGAQISADFEGEELVVLGVLNGSFLFLADLVRAIPLPLSCEFINFCCALFNKGISEGTTGCHNPTGSEQPEA